MDDRKALAVFRGELVDRITDALTPQPVDRAPAVWQQPTPARYTRSRVTSTATLLDQVFGHRTDLGGAHPGVLTWLAGQNVPVSPAHTVFLLKGVGLDYRSAHGTLYLPGHLVIDPDFARRPGAGVYLCASRRNVELFVPGRYRLMLVEVACADLHPYDHDRRKIIASRVYVHREMP